MGGHRLVAPARFQRGCRHRRRGRGSQAILWVVSATLLILVAVSMLIWGDDRTVSLPWSRQFNTSKPSDEAGGDPLGAREISVEGRERAAVAADTGLARTKNGSDRATVVVQSALLIPLPWIEVRSRTSGDWRRVSASGPLMELAASSEDRDVKAPAHRQALLRHDADLLVLQPDSSLSLACEKARDAGDLDVEFMSGSRLSATDMARVSDCHVAGTTPTGFSIAVDVEAFRSMFGAEEEARLFLAMPSGRRMDVRWTPVTDQHIEEPVECSLFTPLERGLLEVRAHHTPASSESTGEELELQLHALDDFDVRSNAFRAPTADIRDRTWGRLVIQRMSQLDARRATCRTTCRIESVALGCTYCITASCPDRQHFGRTVFRFDGSPIDLAIQAAPRFLCRVVAQSGSRCPIGTTATVRMSYDDPGGQLGLAAWAVDEQVALSAEDRISVAGLGRVPSNPLVPDPTPFPVTISVSVGGYAEWKQVCSWGASSTIDAGDITLQPIPGDLSILPLSHHRDMTWLAAFTARRAKEYLVERVCHSGESTELYLEQSFDPLEIDSVLLVRDWSGEASAFQRSQDRRWTESPEREYSIGVHLSETLADRDSVTIGWSWHGIDFPIARLDAAQAEPRPIQFTFRGPESGLALWRVLHHTSSGIDDKKSVPLDSTDAIVTL